MLLARFQHELTEAGCDEAGRGCLAGPVFAAAVILPVGLRDDVQDRLVAGIHPCAGELERRPVAVL